MNIFAITVIFVLFFSFIIVESRSNKKTSALTLYRITANTQRSMKV